MIIPLTFRKFLKKIKITYNSNRKIRLFVFNTIANFIIYIEPHENINFEIIYYKYLDFIRGL
jgi:hypothetical protein